MTKPKTIGILIFPDAEVLDVCGPFEVFSVASRVGEDPDTAPPLFDVHLVASSPLPVALRGGMHVAPHYDLDGCPALDVLVVPGGCGRKVVEDDERTIAWIRERAEEVEWVTSVCTGSILLAIAGSLDGRRATTHYGALDEMKKRFSNVSIERELRVVRDGNILTSAGISAGIDMALRLVEILQGETVARNTARTMEYPFPETDRR